MTQNNEDLLTSKERKELYKKLKYLKEETIKSIIIHRNDDENTKKELLSKIENDDPSDYGRDGIRHVFRT